MLDVKAAARASKCWLWTDSNPVAPWEWRAAQCTGAGVRGAAELAESMAKRKPAITGPKCPPCGSFLKAYKAPTPPLFMFGDYEAARTAFIAAQGPHLGACKFCDLKGFAWCAKTSYMLMKC